jgi:hypothetical protein
MQGGFKFHKCCLEQSRLARTKASFPALGTLGERGDFGLHGLTVVLLLSGNSAPACPERRSRGASALQNTTGGAQKQLQQTRGP